jgi:hypothetical protein
VSSQGDKWFPGKNLLLLLPREIQNEIYKKDLNKRASAENNGTHTKYHEMIQLGSVIINV